MSAFRVFLDRAASGRALTGAEMRAAMDLLLEGAASDIEAAGFLMALRARGESVEEIAAAAEAMREKATKVAAPADVIDTCGTGGDGAGAFNISTAAALVAAGAGAKVAKHGNRAVTSKSGSSEVLEALGVNLAAPPETIARAIREAGVGFMFAAYHHRAVANVAGARKALGVRTLFNLLGPLANPAGARRQLMGVFSKDLVEPLAEALLRLGAEAAWVVHGSDGLDELTTTGPSFVAEVKAGRIRRFEIAPEDADLPRAAPEALKGGGPAENAEAVRALLAGAPSAYRDIVVLNAAAALVIAGVAPDLREGARRAARAIDEGRARAALDRLVAVTNEGAS
ncbi:anthranilate phosphoribosyltransferase [Amphiplicatus metriothermophilus]|uniref:Anthranilate phosphoribosyltransferase n=1 Tax=Amphiplicatus metriothermophilus TaxID=1519374 RepID=A0A239Q0G2_9PROT|nr:anthranilate phosphoribosyltransferase [Amphiplicatus metriothermophilus]MBB5520052.1 anthranilate phosphoribosyltransferase [Amphiplicatus metriothermophilus]SNT75828.1 anthranilate phosphoribosyltransferase [Amphiplicatus metriothermophilus]